MKESWTPIHSAVVLPILSSGLTYELQSGEQPTWAREAKQFLRFFAYGLAPGESAPSFRTTNQVVGRLLSERHDPKDEAPFNYNWYWVVQSSDGSFYHSGPHRDVDFGHHLYEPILSLSMGVSIRHL
jgi:hypothetical protein